MSDLQIPEVTEEMRRAGMSEARFRRILAEPYPQFGHAGRHHGNGSPDCPRHLHHHHDEFCKPPTPMEWHLAGREGEVVVGSRA